MVFVISDVAGLCPNGFSAPNQINMIAKLKRSSVSDERLSQVISQESTSRTFFNNERTIFPPLLVLCQLLSSPTAMLNALTHPWVYNAENDSIGRSCSPFFMAVIIRAATASGSRPVGNFGAAPASGRVARPVSV